MKDYKQYTKPTGEALKRLQELIKEAKKDKLILKHKGLLHFYLTPTELEERIANDQAYFSPEYWELASPQVYLDIKEKEFAAAKKKHEKAVAYINNYLFNN